MAAYADRLPRLTLKAGRRAGYKAGYRLCRSRRQPVLPERGKNAKMLRIWSHPRNPSYSQLGKLVLMSTSTRRKFLQCGAVLGLGSVLPLMMTSNAAAYYQEAVLALAAASFIANQIGNHNRRNVELYMIGSVREELRVATLQLASLQAGVADILNEISKLPKFFEDALRANSIRDIQTKIKTEVSLYLEEMEVRPQYSDDLQWITASRRTERLNNILDNLARYRHRLVSESLIDPTSATVMCSASLVEVNLMNLSNIAHTVYDQVKILDVIRRYEEYFDLVASNAVGSSKQYLAEHRKARDGYLAALEDNVLWRQLKKEKSLTNCAQVRIYEPPGPRGPCELAKIACDNTWYDYHRVFQEINYREVDAQKVPEVRALLAQSHLVPDPITELLILRELSIGDPVYQYKATENEEWAGGPNTDKPELLRGKGPSNCGPTQGYMKKRPFRVREMMTRRDERESEKYIMTTPEFTKIAKHQPFLTSTIDNLNLECTKVAYATEALGALEKTREALNVVKRSYDK